MSVATQYRPSGTTASEIAAGVERAIRERRLVPGERLPTVRGLAGELTLSPATVAAAYRRLRERGLVTGAGRQGTTVAARPAVSTRGAPPVPDGVRDLAAGAPDPRLLPRLGPGLRGRSGGSRGYDVPAVLPRLRELAAAGLAADGVATGSLTVVGGAMDGLERVLAARLQPGDRVAVEDPGYANLLDLLAAMGLRGEPVALDGAGPLPTALASALRAGVRAVVLTPRAQNPTGAALGAARATELRRLLRAAPADLLVIEDDHAGAVAGAPYRSVVGGRNRWAVVRSMSKQLGPDLRMAFLAGDPETIGRVAGRYRLGAGWVSSLLQETVAGLLGQPGIDERLDRAARSYARRRTALLDALAARGVDASGASGLNVWVPVADEAGTVLRLARAGWAVGAGHRFRLRSGPAIRICVAPLDLVEIDGLAGAVAESLAAPARYAG